MAMTQEERSFLQAQIEQKYAWFNRGSRTWSFLYNGSTLTSAILAASAAVFAKLTYLQSVLSLTDANINDIVALLSSLAALTTTISGAGGVGRKWQANRISRGRIERLRIALSDPDADAEKFRNAIQDVMQKHDEAIVGPTLK